MQASRTVLNLMEKLEELEKETCCCDVDDLNEKIKQIYNLKEKIFGWFKKRIEDWDDSIFYDPFITTKPIGERQEIGEYCFQIQTGDDSFYGEYYYKIKGTNKYIGFHFEI